MSYECQGQDIVRHWEWLVTKNTVRNYEQNLSGDKTCIILWKRASTPSNLSLRWDTVTITQPFYQNISAKKTF